jgi:hypothetical protein
MKTLIVVGCCVLAACTVRRDGSTVDVDPVTDRIGEWSATLASMNNSNVRGSVTAKSAVAGAGVTINITGAQSGARHPWHVHRGTCANSGSIVGGADEYPVLEPGSAGTATASANIEVALSEDSQYSVNVHRSPTELGAIIACGDLRK